MSEMCHTGLCVCVCVRGRAKPAWHTKAGERCYLVSELSLCLPYISAPKPQRLSITGEKEPVAKGEGVRNPIISSYSDLPSGESDGERQKDGVLTKEGCRVKVKKMGVMKGAGGGGGGFLTIKRR